MMRHLLLIVALSMALAVGGCASTGRNTYACAGYPSRPLCLPPSQIYQITNGSGPPPATAVRPSTLGAPVQGRDVSDGFLGFGRGRSTNGEDA